MPVLFMLAATIWQRVVAILRQVVARSSHRRQDEAARDCCGVSPQRTGEGIRTGMGCSQGMRRLMFANRKSR